MKRDSRRIFSSAEQIGKFSPVLIIRFAHKHPDDFKALIESGQIPSEEDADKLDAAALVPILTSAGVSEELGESLFMINVFSTPRNRRILEDEVRATRPARGLDFPLGLSDADYALTVWLKRPSILEAALSRVTLKSRRTFHYFAPSDPQVASSAPAMTDESLATLTERLKAAFSLAGRNRGLKVTPFLDDPFEDWFLLRRSRLPERITFFENDDQEKSKTVMLRVYDAVVFDRINGVLKVNAPDELVELYRQAFSLLYGHSMTFFEERDLFTLDPLRSAAATTVSVTGTTGLSSVDLFSVGYTIEENGTPTDFHVKRKNWYATTIGTKAPVPTESRHIKFAVFEVHTAHRKQPRRCRVEQGNTLSFSRDDEAKAFENFLCLRGFARGMDAIIRTKAA